MAASPGTSAAATPRIEGDTLPVAALVVYGDGTVQSANPLACGLFGLPAGQLAGMSIDRLLSPVSRMVLHTHVLPRLSEGGLVQGTILSVVNTAGAEVDVVVNASVIAPGDPRAIAMLLLPTPGDRSREERFLRMQRAADAAPAMLFEWVVGPQGRGRLPYASAGLLTLFGLTADSVRDDDGPLIARLHPDDVARVRDELRLAAEAPRPAFGRYRARLDAADDWSWYGLRATSRRAPGGETVWHGTWTDVTQQRRAEEAEKASAAQAAAAEVRREHDEFVRLLVDVLPARVGYWDRHLVCRFANRQFCEWMGHPADQVVGRRSIDLVGEERERPMRPYIEGALAGQPQTFDRDEPAADGRIDSRVVRFQPDVRDGVVQGFFVLGTDVSDLKAAERQLRGLNEQLAAALDRAEAATRAKSSFLANMSHEIRTPMNAIIGLSYLLRRELQEPQQIDRLAKIGAAAQHLLQLINDILDLSKIEAGKLGLEDIAFDLDEVIAGAFDLVAQRATEKGLELVVDTPHVPARLRGDPTRLSQALVNFLANAVKFTDRGWVRLRAFVLTSTRERLLLRFEVEDTGRGVSAAQIGRLFQPFEQGDISTTREHGGTGLGLALTRRLAQLMGGEAGATGRPGSGSTFWFSASFGHVAEAPPPPAEWQGLRAMLVDDLAEAAAPLEAWLHRAGLQVDTETDPARAIARVVARQRGGERVDLLLVDWRMAPRDGIAVLTELHDQLGTAMPPSILLAAGDEPAMWQAAHATGCHAVLVKPITASALQAALVRVLGTRAAPDTGAADAGGIDLEAALRRDHAGQRILLAEDNPINQFVACELLQAVGLQVETADDGDLAIERACSHPFDLVLMDVQMPRRDGLSAASAIRARLGPRLPIIAMTANAFAED
ncbi:MAG: response regulator, partial [Ideonella sp.]|nr:response regulator [Ideonella sp.]